MRGSARGKAREPSFVRLEMWGERDGVAVTMKFEHATGLMRTFPKAWTRRSRPPSAHV